MKNNFNQSKKYVVEITEKISQIESLLFNESLLAKTRRSSGKKIPEQNKNMSGEVHDIVVKKLNLSMGGTTLRKILSILKDEEMKPLILAGKLPVMVAYNLKKIHEKTFRIYPDLDSKKYRIYDKTGSRISSCIFLVEKEGERKLVKIGSSAQLPLRLLSIQRNSPKMLVFLGAVPGGVNEEIVLHKRFKVFRAHAEWFYFEKIKEEIQIYLSTFILNKHN